MKCTVDGVEYERVENNTEICCKGCVADGMSQSSLVLCQRLKNCRVEVGKNHIWVKVEHASNS